jgi:NAD(P)-dependent dehydrogenase (short-subunit alcohol dehydrogenase family)
MPQLVDRVALVAGGAGGIGAGIAGCLAAAGAVIVVADVNEPAAAQVSERLLGLGARAESALLDIRSAAAVERVVASVAERFGHIDILVNAAGVLPIGNLVETEDEEWELTLGVNLTGAFYLSRAAARRMIPRRAGKIIHLVSDLAPTQLTGAYNVAKHGLWGLIRSLALELAEYQINVNGIAPGVIPATGMMKKGMVEKARRIGIPLEEFWRSAESGIPWGRVGTPEDVGRAALFLASDDAEYVTGELLHVTGGYHGFAARSRTTETWEPGLKGGS